MTTDDDGNVVRVTLRNVYDDLTVMKAAVDLLVERLPKHIEQTHDDLSELKDRIRDHEERLRKIEARVWMSVGGLSILITIVGLINQFTAN